MTARHPHDYALDVDLPALLADYRALRDGELAEQRTRLYVLDPDSIPLPAALAALPEATR